MLPPPPINLLFGDGELFEVFAANSVLELAIQKRRNQPV
jgi:hypothetical protein